MNPTLTRPFDLELSPDEVFVFGTAAGGMHHAGAAGIAMHGSLDAPYSSDEELTEACGGPGAVGRWTALGHVQGAYKGKNGNGYAIQTRIDGPRSMPLRGAEPWDGKLFSEPLGDIGTQLSRLVALALKKPELTFLVTPLGQGKSGYSAAEISALWDELTLPDNIHFVQLIR